MREVGNLSPVVSNGTRLLDDTRYEHNHFIHSNLTCCVVAMSVDVEWVFSRGRLILSHTRSWLSVSSTRALLCLGSWCLRGLVKDEDVTTVALLDEVQEMIELGKLGDLFEEE